MSADFIRTRSYWLH